MHTNAYTSPIYLVLKKKSHFMIWPDSFIIWWPSYSINHRFRCTCDRPVAHLMSNGESHRQPRVLVDVAAAVRLTHPRQMGQTQSLTGLVHSSTNVFPRDHSPVRDPHWVTWLRTDVGLKLAWWSKRPRHDELGACHSGGWGFFAKHRSWTEWCRRGERSSTLSATQRWLWHVISQAAFWDHS